MRVRVDKSRRYHAVCSINNLIFDLEQIESAAVDLTNLDNLIVIDQDRLLSDRFRLIDFSVFNQDQHLISPQCLMGYPLFEGNLCSASRLRDNERLRKSLNRA